MPCSAPYLFSKYVLLDTSISSGYASERSWLVITPIENCFSPFFTTYKKDEPSSVPSSEVLVLKALVKTIHCPSALRVTQSLCSCFVLVFEYTGVAQTNNIATKANVLIAYCSSFLTISDNNTLLYGVFMWHIRVIVSYFFAIASFFVHALDIKSESALLMDMKTSAVIYGKNAHEKIVPSQEMLHSMAVAGYLSDKCSSMENIDAASIIKMLESSGQFEEVLKKYTDRIGMHQTKYGDVAATTMYDYALMLKDLEVNCPKALACIPDQKFMIVQISQRKWLVVTGQYGNSDSYSDDVTQLLSYAEHNFRVVPLIKRGAVLAKAKVWHGDDVEITVQSDIDLLLPKSGSGKALSVKLIMPTLLTAPLQKDAAVGTILIENSDGVSMQFPAITAHDVPSCNILSRMYQNFIARAWGN